MQVNTGKLQILTAAAILVLISGGIAAYAQEKNFSLQPLAAADQQSSTSTSTSSSNETSKSTAAAAVTTTTTTTAGPPCTPPVAPGQVGRLTLPISPGQSQSGTIVFAGSKGCVASITTIGGVFSVEITLRYAKPVTQYNVVLVANGTSYPLGNMVTGPEGSGQMQNQVLLKTGTYTVSIQIFDTSTTPGTSTLVMQSAQGTIVSAAFPAPGTNSGHSQPGSAGNGEKSGS
jgi:hypothetical protein